MWLLTFMLGPSPKHSPHFVLLAASLRNSLWLAIPLLVSGHQLGSLGEHMLLVVICPLGQQSKQLLLIAVFSFG